MTLRWWVSVYSDDFVLGVDFGGSKTALATADRAGALLCKDVLQVSPGQSGSLTVGTAIEAACRLIKETERRHVGRCVAAGVATPGIPKDGGIALSPNLSGWTEVSLRGDLSAGLGIDNVAVANDVKCAAQAELRWGSLRGVNPGVYINLGTGVAAGIVINGRVVEGAHGGAGEIGYARFWAPGHAEESTLEDLIGGRHLLERAQGLGLSASSLADAFSAPPGTPLHRLTETALDGLAAQLQMVALLLDPERIAIGGGLMTYSPRILGALCSRLELPAPLAPDIVSARFVNDASLRGALSLVVDDLASQAVAGRGCDQ